MSSALKLNAADLKNLGECLRRLTEAHIDLNVRFTPYAPLDLEIGNSHVQINWDEELREYIVDDRVGD